MRHRSGVQENAELGSLQLGMQQLQLMQALYSFLPTTCALVLKELDQCTSPSSFEAILSHYVEHYVE